MTIDEVIIENVLERKSPRVGLLFFLSLYTVWQMGIVFNSSSALSLQGGGNTLIQAFLVGFGYLFSALLLWIWGKKTIRFLKIGFLFICLASLWNLVATKKIHSNAVLFFLCVTMIGLMMAYGVFYLTPVAYLTYMVVTMLMLGGILFAFSFIEGAVKSVFLDLFPLATGIGGLLYFRFVPQGKSVILLEWKHCVPIPPKPALALLFLFILSCFETLFSSAVAESIEGGKRYMYFGVLVSAIFFWFLWRKRGMEPLSIVRILFVLNATGFLFCFASFFASTGLSGCILLGAGMIPCCIMPYLMLLSFTKKPLRLLLPCSLLATLLTVCIHESLLPLMKNNRSMGCTVYVIVSLLLIFLYFLFEPMFVVLEKDEERQQGKEFSILFPELTGQEQRVISLILQGMTTKEIAMRMNISIGTEKGYRNHAYMKLSIHSRQELFSLAETRNSL